MMEKLYAEIEAERQRALAKLPEGYEDKNTMNDYVAYITAYLGRAARGVFRNERENQTFRENMVKVAALAVAALVRWEKEIN